MGKNLTFAQQALGLQSRFPDARIKIRRHKLKFVADLTPSPLSETYSVRIEFDGVHRPVIKVLSPTLRHPPERDVPHTFEEDTLCLHLPGEWSASDLITYMIVPWTVEWLLHYEIWLATEGTWCGGGHEPGALN